MGNAERRFISRREHGRLQLSLPAVLRGSSTQPEDVFKAPLALTVKRVVVCMITVRGAEMSPPPTSQPAYR